MTAPVPIVEGFSLSHAQILDGATAFMAADATKITEDVYGVDDGSLDPDTSDFDNEGDDAVLSSWQWLNFANVSVRAGYLSFPLVAHITGAAISSSGSGATIAYGMDLWHEDSMNVASKPMVLRMPSKDRDGKVRNLTIGLYKVSFQPITFDGPTYKDGLKVNYKGKCLMSPTDEVGALFADGKKRIGKLISHSVS
jgi:hypothetical protein